MSSRFSRILLYSLILFQAPGRLVCRHYLSLYLYFICFAGRNGGHLTVTPFPGFCDHARLHGKEQALRELAIQRYTVEEILKIVRELGQEDHVDLVSNAHVDIFSTEEELISAKADYEAAQAVGVVLSHVEWLSREQMKSVSPHRDVLLSCTYLALHHFLR